MNNIKIVKVRQIVSFIILCSVFFFLTTITWATTPSNVRLMGPPPTTPLDRGDVSGIAVPDITGLAELNYNINYIGAGNISNMIMDFLWSAQPVDWAVAQGAVFDVFDGGDLGALQQNAQTWTDVPSSIFTYNEVSFDGFWGLADGSSEIGWIYDLATWNALGLGPSTLAATYTIPQPSPNGDKFSEFDILFNGVFFYWYADSADPFYSLANSINIGSAGLHELGHGLGLIDLYNPGVPDYQPWMGDNNENYTMYGYTVPHNDDITLAWADIEAITLAYPIPEPATLLLFGLGGLVLLKKRSKTR